MSARSRALIPLSAEQQAAMQAVAVRTTSSSGTHTFSMALCQRFLSLPEWQSPDFADRSPLFCPCADEGGISWQPSPVAGCRG